MKQIFADAFYYIALLNPADQFHVKAIQVTKNLTCALVTTAWVLIEVADALSSPAVRDRTHRFIRQVLNDAGTLVVIDHGPWYERWLALYGNRPDKSWSLTDCISFAVMTDKGISEALTGGHHFFQAGFQILLPSAGTTQ
jgi:predicted nucleic acid-binding protein